MLFVQRSSSCFKDIFRRRRSASVSTGSVIHSLYVILEVAVTPRPDLDDFRRDSSRGTSGGFDASCRDSTFPADLASDPAVPVDLANDPAVLANFAIFVWWRRFLGPCRFFLGDRCKRPSSRDC